MIVLLFGATGSAGGSVLRACLDAAEVTEVRALVRRVPTVTDPKLRAIVHRDFADYRGAEAAFAGVDACFYCLGKSVRQVSGEPDTASSPTTTRWRRPARCWRAAPVPCSSSSAAAART